MAQPSKGQNTTTTSLMSEATSRSSARSQRIGTIQLTLCPGIIPSGGDIFLSLSLDRLFPYLTYQINLSFILIRKDCTLSINFHLFLQVESVNSMAPCIFINNKDFMLAFNVYYKNSLPIPFEYKKENLIIFFLMLLYSKMQEYIKDLLIALRNLIQ